MGTNLANTKVLLLGYTGYIGTTLAKVLLEKKLFQIDQLSFVIFVKNNRLFN